MKVFLRMGILGFITLFVLATSGVSAQAEVRASRALSAAVASNADNVRLIGQSGGAVNAVYVADNKAYISQGVSMAILDVTDAGQPKLLGRTLPLTDRTNGLVVQGSIAYLAASTAGLYLVDVSIPSLPVLLSAYDTPGSALDVFIVGQYVYVADFSNGLRIVDVSNPSVPREVGFYDTPGSAQGVYVSGNYAYVADDESGLRVVNVSNPAAPSEVGFFDTPGGASGVYVAGNYAYIADSDSGLHVVDVSNPAAPSEVGVYDTLGYAEAVSGAGQYVYVADGSNGLRVVNVSNPALPSEVGFSTVPEDALGVFVTGNTAYVADANNGLRVVDVSNPATPTAVGFYDTLGFASGVAFFGNHAYVTDYYGNLRVVNVSNPALPSEVGVYDTPGVARGVHVVNNYAYVADEAGLRIVNVSNPAAPSEVGFFSTPAWAWDVYVSGNIAYVAGGSTGLRLINVSNPAQPTAAGFYTPPGYIVAVHVAGNYAYLADGDEIGGNSGLRIINVSNPAAPQQVGFSPTANPLQSVFVAGNYAYVGDRTGLRVIAVSNPAQPTQSGFYATVGSASALAVSGSHVYIANNFGGLRVVNVSQPATPISAGFYDTPGFAADVAVGGNYAYVAGGTGGLYILRYPACYTLQRKVNGQGALPTLSLDRSPGCQLYEYLPGTQVTLSANPSPSWQVASWVGTNNDNTTSRNNQLTMPAADHEVTVNYAPVCYGLALTHSGNGNNPTPNPTSSIGCAFGQYVAGQTITLTATPGTGSLVVNWSGTTNDGSTAGENTLVMPANNHTAGVNYGLACYQLTLTHTGSGADPVATPGQAGGCANGQYHYNDAVTLSASPASGWLVSAWSGTTNNSITATTNSLLMPASNYAAGVHYGEIPVVAVGDLYELDNGCTRSRPITTDGSEVQPHSFHVGGDVDWVRFDAAANSRYRIEVTVPTTSTADVVMELYGDCASAPLDQWTGGFSPGARLDISRTVGGPTYVRLGNNDAAVAGELVRYDVSVRKLDEAPPNRALIIVAGRLKLNDPVQPNIDKVASNVYKLFQRNGYTNSNIQLFASNANLPGFAGAASKTNLQAAIQQAASKVGNGVLTLYMVDHGSPERFYLDGVNQEILTPSELNDWLNQLESSTPGVKINVIIEACESGSFIDQPNSISKAGRVVLTSSNADNDAKASKEGAYFSDHLLTWLQQGYNLSASFFEARTAAKSIYSLQDAWLDSNGNGLANEFDDAALAAQRSFAYAGSLPGDEWPPHIFKAEAVDTVQGQTVRLRVDVRDDAGVRQVWAVVYEPGYTPPPANQVLQPEVLPTFLFTRVDNDSHWEAEVSGLTKQGIYRFFIHADDEQGLVARPAVVEVNTAGSNDGKLFLPIVTR